MTTPTTTTPMLSLRRFWRIPVVAVIGAILGFGASYLFGVTYEAKTRVLNRVNNVTFLGNDGSTLEDQGTAFEQSALSRIVAETEGALMENHVIATKVVRELRLDQEEDEKGWFATLKRGFAKAFKFTYSYLVHGTYEELDDFDQAVEDTESGLQAKQVGNSYVIEVTGRWDTPEDAKAIADVAADYLIELAEEQFVADVTANMENLAQQLELLGQQQQAAATELAVFAEANGIDPAVLGPNTLTPALALQLSPEQQSSYQQLQRAYNTSLAAYTQLQVEYQQGQVNAGTKPVELTRLDEAVASVYPVSPKRWLYMGIGIVLGSLVGLGLTARAVWRRGETLFPRDDDLHPGPGRAPREDRAGGGGEAGEEPAADETEAVAAAATPEEPDSAEGGSPPRGGGWPP